MTDDRRAVAYRRVSSQLQATTGSSLESDQPAIIERLRSAHQLAIVAEFVDVMTGSTNARPGLGELREYVAEHGIRHVLIAYTDRATRAQARAERGELVDWLEDQGVTLYASDGVYQLGADGTGGLMLDISTAFAAHWWRLHRQRLRDSWRSRVECGVATFGRPPYGMDRIPREAMETGDPELREAFIAADLASGRRVPSLFRPNADAAVVLEIVARYLAGERPHAICRALNERGQSGPLGCWRPEAIFRLLRQPVYGGLVARKLHNGPLERVAVNIAPILPPDTWSMLQVRLGADARFLSRVSGTSRGVLNGLLVCGSCGSKLHAVGAKTRLLANGGRTNCGIVYRCARSKDHAGCDQPGISDTRIIPALVEHIRPHLRAELVREPDDDPGAAERVARRGELAAQRERLTDLYISGDLTRTEYDRRKADLDSQTARLDAQEPQARAVMQVLEADIDHLLSTREGIRTIARSVVARIVVKDGCATMPPEWIGSE